MSMLNSFLSSINNSTTPPVDTSFDVFIVAGQSNSDGRVLLADAPSWLDQNNPINTGVKIWNSSDNQFNNFELGVDTGSAVPDTTLWAYDLEFSHLYYEYSNKPVYLIKRTQGGTPIYINTGITKGCWNVDFNNIPDGTPKLLLELKENYDNAKTYIEGLGKTMNLIGILWHQGESDYSPSDAENSYETNFSDVISYIRNDIVSGVTGSTLSIIYGSISHTSAEYSSVVETAQFNIASSDSNAYIVNMSGGTLLDAYHFDADSSIYLGNEMYNIVIGL